MPSDCDNELLANTPTKGRNPGICRCRLFLSATPFAVYVPRNASKKGLLLRVLCQFSLKSVPFFAILRHTRKQLWS